MKRERDRLRVPAAGDVLAYARHLGIRRAFLRSAYVMVNQVLALSIYDCVRLRREDVNAALLDAPSGYTCRFLEPDEVVGFAGELDASGQRVVREALARGDVCYAVLDGKRLANLSCYAQRPTPIQNDLVMIFDAPHWYMHGAFTPVAYRGRRLHALGVLTASLELFDQGIPALVGVYERTNYRSMVSALRMGWKPCGTLFRVGIGPWTHLGGTAAARACGMRLEVRRAQGGTR